MTDRFHPEQYSKQTIFVESIIEAHPDYDPEKLGLFSASEVALFREVFLPDWGTDTFQQVFDHQFAGNPERLKLAQGLLERFCRAIGADPDGLIV